MTSFALPIKRAPHWALLTILAVAFSWMGSAELRAAAPAKPLLELEAHIQWNAVDAGWKGLREGWVAETGDCDSAECVASQLLTLEQHVEWKAVDPKWKGVREGWTARVKG